MSISNYKTGEFIRFASGAEIRRYEMSDEWKSETGAIDGAKVAADLDGITVFMD